MTPNHGAANLVSRKGKIPSVPRKQPSGREFLRDPFVSVVIPTKDAGSLFQEVLDKLVSQKYVPGFEILVVDSGSKDQTLERAHEAGARVLTVAPEEFNHGTTRDFAIQEAKGDVAVLLTQDAVPGGPDLIKNLAQAFEDPSVGGAYARQVPRPSANPLVKRNLDGWLTGRPEAATRRIDDVAQYRALSPMERYMFCNFDNVCSAVRKTAWKMIPFGWAAFGEDISWGRRALEAGWRIAYEPGAHVVHSHERPIGYEYKRTYLCHSKLYTEFGLQTVPTFRAALRSSVLGTAQDVGYLRKCHDPLGVRLSTLLRVPALNAAMAFAQWRGARAAKRGTTRTIRSV